MDKIPHIGFSSFELSVWFWGLLYLFFIFGIPAYYGYKEVSSFWANPMEKRTSVIGVFTKIFLMIIFSYSLAQILLAITDPFFRSKYYLSIFLKYLRGG